MVTEGGFVLGYLVVGGLPNVEPHLDGVVRGFDEPLLHQGLQLDVFVVAPTLPLIET